MYAKPPMSTEADHADYLAQVLQSLMVTAEERFDTLAVEHLRRHRLAHRLGPIKKQMLLDCHAYRVELRGRPYLCRLRPSGVVDELGRPTVVAWDVASLLDALCRAAACGCAPANDAARG